MDATSHGMNLVLLSLIVALINRLRLLDVFDAHQVRETVDDALLIVEQMQGRFPDQAVSLEMARAVLESYFPKGSPKS